MPVVGSFQSHTQVSKDVDHIVVAWNECGKPTELVAQKRIIDGNATFANLFADRPVKKYEGVVYCENVSTLR